MMPGVIVILIGIEMGNDNDHLHKLLLFKNGSDNNRIMIFMNVMR